MGKPCNFIKVDRRKREFYINTFGSENLKVEKM